MEWNKQEFLNAIQHAIIEMEKSQSRLNDKTKQIELCKGFLKDVKDILSGFDGNMGSRPALENYETSKTFSQYIQHSTYDTLDREFIAICADLRAFRVEEKKLRDIENNLQGYTKTKRGFSVFRTILWLVLFASVILIGFGAFKSVNQSVYERIGFWIDAIGLLVGVIAFIVERYSDSQKARAISEQCNISIVKSQIVKGCFNFAVFHSKTKKTDDDNNENDEI